MKPIIPFALLGALLTLGAHGQTATNPVGYVSLGDQTLGQPALAANNEVTFAVSLLGTVQTVASVDSAALNGGNIEITINETLVAGEFDAPAPGTPFVVEITSGDSDGLQAVIVSNTASVTPRMQLELRPRLWRQNAC